MISFANRDIFDAGKDAILVNTVNCVGVMGKGVAKQFRERFPNMFARYKRDCQNGLVRPGEVRISVEGGHTIVNLPTKRHWRDPSRIEDVRAGLFSLRDALLAMPFQSGATVALPPPGCGCGGLNWLDVRKIICEALDHIPMHIMVSNPLEAPAPSVLSALVKRYGQSKAEEIDGVCRKNGWSIITKEDPLYPERLLEVKAPPDVIFAEGDLSLLLRPHPLAIIGTRAPTSNTQKRLFHIAKETSERGWPVVSGLALGCDTAAHEGALHSKGGTIAWLAHGLDDNLLYPSANRALRKEMAKKGLLLTEYAPGVQACASAFVTRDFLQAGMSEGLILGQSGLKGGSRHASGECERLGRPLAVLARGKDMESVTGDGKFSLNKAFYEKGAHLIWKAGSLETFFDAVEAGPVGEVEAGPKAG